MKEIQPGTTIKQLIEMLSRYDPEQQLLTQVILPDGKAWMVEALLFEVPQSDCTTDGRKLKFVGLQMDCERAAKRLQAVKAS